MVKRIIIIMVVCLFVAGIAYARRNAGKPNERPPISLRMALALAEAELEKEEAKYFCVGASLARTLSERDWTFEFSSEAGTVIWVSVGSDKKVVISQDRAAASFVADDIKPEKREELGTAISEGIRLLKAKEYEVFIISFVPPTERKKIEDVSLEEFVQWFGERKAPELYEVLVEIKDSKPDLDDTGTKATFVLKEEMNGKKSITFIKIENFWYINN